jgi:hypothetical protein
METRTTELDKAEHLHFLSSLVFGPARSANPKKVTNWDGLWKIAEAHHVLIRAGSALESTLDSPDTSALRKDLWDRIAKERTRAESAMRRLPAIFEALTAEGIPVAVIKSLDHWPDFGADIDLFTDAPESLVSRLMKTRLDAQIVPPSLSDRLAAKVNYRLPGLDELIEIHFGRLGQTGEHTELAQRVLRRRCWETYGEKAVPVPAVEERILLAVLQRMYRHFFLRISDIENTRRTLEEGALDFDELRHSAKRAGIWPGVATYLNLCSQYLRHYRGRGLHLPRRILDASRFNLRNVYPHAGFLRLPLFPQAASLYTRQFVRSVRSDPASSLRLSLLPPLAAAAGMKFRLTGSDKGLW